MRTWPHGREKEQKVQVGQVKLKTQPVSRNEASSRMQMKPISPPHTSTIHASQNNVHGYQRAVATAVATTGYNALMAVPGYAILDNLE